MVRGFPPTQGRRQTLITMGEILQSGATSDVQWYGSPAVRVMGCDPAFTEGGNKATMQAMDIGFDVNMQLKLSFLEPKTIPIESSSKVPVLAQVGDAIHAYAEEMGIPAGLIGVDDSATQSVADYLVHTHHMPVVRFVSNKKASELLITDKDKQPACERFHDQSTELWASVAAFLRAGQMRNFPLTAAEQLTSRPMEPGKRPLRLLSKRTTRREGNEMKSDSPDEMDAVAYCTGIARFVLHLIAGSATLPTKYGSAGLVPANHNRSGLRKLAQRYDLDARSYGEPAAAQ